jgi:acetyl-CoA carboxylase alpha subunit
MALVGDALAQHLEELARLPPDELLARRYTKFRRMGEVAIVEPTNESAPG